MMYLTNPRPLMTGRLKESIPIFMDEITAADRLHQGMIKLKPGVDYPQEILDIAEKEQTLH